MKVILRVFEYKHTIEKEFASAEEAQRVLGRMSEKHPNLMIEPYFEVDESCVMDISKVC